MTPIKTIIRNKTAVAKAVNYIGKSPVWLPANGEATVEFEVWSVADDRQKTALKTAIRDGKIELTVMLLGGNGEYTVVAFDPTGGLHPVKKEPVYLKSTNPIKQMAEEKDHIVKVGSEGSQKALESMGAKTIGFEDEDIIPPREVKNGEPEPAKEEAKQEEKPIEDTAAAADDSESGAKKASAKKGSKAKA